MADLHPRIRELLDRQAAAVQPPPHELAPESARERAATAVEAGPLLDDPEPVGAVEAFHIPGPDGPVPVRVYVPDGDGPVPVLVFAHGGGWTAGSLDAADNQCRRFAVAADCVVVSVDYRLAPEHPFPAGHEDVYAALEWTARNAESLRGDADRLAVGGVSAGANIAAGVALRSRDCDGPALDYQVLCVPALAYEFDTDSYHEHGEGYEISREYAVHAWDSRFERTVDRHHPYAAPLEARDLSGVAPAFVGTGDLDPLRDDGRRYVDRLRAAGVSVTHENYADLSHGAYSAQYLALDIDPVVEAFADAASALRAAVHGAA